MFRNFRFIIDCHGYLSELTVRSKFFTLHIKIRWRTQKYLILVGYFEDGDEALHSVRCKEFLSWLIFSRMALLHGGS
jgi:hypothetical protein